MMCSKTAYRIIRLPLYAGNSMLIYKATTTNHTTINSMSRCFFPGKWKYL